jgi:hypothetical protein
MKRMIAVLAMVTLGACDEAPIDYTTGHDGTRQPEKCWDKTIPCHFVETHGTPRVEWDHYTIVWACVRPWPEHGCEWAIWLREEQFDTREQCMQAAMSRKPPAVGMSPICGDLNK